MYQKTNKTQNLNKKIIFKLQSKTKQIRKVKRAASFVLNLNNKTDKTNHNQKAGLKKRKFKPFLNEKTKKKLFLKVNRILTLKYNYVKISPIGSVKKKLKSSFEKKRKLFFFHVKKIRNVFFRKTPYLYKAKKGKKKVKKTKWMLKLNKKILTPIAKKRKKNPQPVLKKGNFKKFFHKIPPKLFQKGLLKIYKKKKRLEKIFSTKLNAQLKMKKFLFIKLNEKRPLYKSPFSSYGLKKNIAKTAVYRKKFQKKKKKKKNLNFKKYNAFIKTIGFSRYRYKK